MSFMMPNSEKEALEARKADDAPESLMNSIILPEHDFDISNEDGSFLLVDADEKLRFTNPDSFCKMFKCKTSKKLKVISIFGNAGVGKSYTMNHTLFKGEQMFKTSSDAHSCTAGVIGAIQHELGVLCLDTEGLQTISTKSETRNRVLIKVLALSDIIIYLTKSERLGADMYKFLGRASEAYNAHLTQLLPNESNSNLGPALIVFHETREIQPLENTITENAEEKIRAHFSQLGYSMTAFSSLRYVGIRTAAIQYTDFSKLQSAINCELDNTSVRTPRSSKIIFQTLIALNNKYSGEITRTSTKKYLEKYFTCPIVCISCDRRCERSRGHDDDHFNEQLCKYEQNYENKYEYCKICYNKGQEIRIMRIDSWTHSIITCMFCGELSRNFKYWHDVEDSKVIHTQIAHVWVDKKLIPKRSSYKGQMVVDTLSVLSDTVTSYASQPTIAVKAWCADQMAPNYWKPNNEVIVCHNCRKNLKKSGLKKHHCRGCGNGFCDSCSRYRSKIPARGWYEKKRVCSSCHQQLLEKPNEIPCEISRAWRSTATSTSTSSTMNLGNNISLRKYGETLYNTVSTVTSAAVRCTKKIVKDTTRPDYWVPDAQAVCCHICNMMFGTIDELMVSYSHLPERAKEAFKLGGCKRHHCRKCGKAVCEECSLARVTVPECGWQYKVRVCDDCVNTHRHLRP